MFTKQDLFRWRIGFPSKEKKSGNTSIAEASRLVGVSPHAWGAWESGKRSIPKWLPLALLAVSIGAQAGEDIPDTSNLFLARRIL